MFPSHLLTPELLAAVNAARVAIGKREIAELPAIDWKGFLHNALSLRPGELVDNGQLWLLSPVDAEELAKLWGTEVVRTGEHCWRVLAPASLLEVERAVWDARDEEKEIRQLQALMAETDSLEPIGRVA